MAWEWRVRQEMAQDSDGIVITWQERGTIKEYIQEISRIIAMFNFLT